VQRGILADPISGTAALEYGPTEILPPVLAKWKALRVSADPVAKPAAHTRAESRGSGRFIADAGKRRTVCWREMDSNPRSPRATMSSHLSARHRPTASRQWPGRQALAVWARRMIWCARGRPSPLSSRFRSRSHRRLSGARSTKASIVLDTQQLAGRVDCRDPRGGGDGAAADDGARRANCGRRHLLL